LYPAKSRPVSPNEESSTRGGASSDGLRSMSMSLFQ
jgi:hypothetical protein